MSVLFHTVLVTHGSLVDFSSTVSIFPLCPKSYLFYSPCPRVSCLLPLCRFDFVGLLFNLLFVFFEFPISYKLFPIALSFIFFRGLLICYKLFVVLVIGLSVLWLVPCPVSVLGSSRLLATGSCCLVAWGLRSSNAAIPCWSCLSYFNYPNFVSSPLNSWPYSRILLCLTNVLSLILCMNRFAHVLKFQLRTKKQRRYGTSPFIWAKFVFHIVKGTEYLCNKPDL
jgi:hypothetical protein